MPIEVYRGTYDVLIDLSLCEFAEQARGRFVHQQEQRAIARANELTRIKVRLIASLEHVLQSLSLILACCEECHVSGVVERRCCQRYSVSLELFHVVGDCYPFTGLERGGAREKRGG